MQNSTSSPTVAYFNLMTKNINDYTAIGMLVIGLPGNLLSILVFSRLVHNKTNMGLIYILQCLIDLFVIIWVGFVIRALTVFTGVTFSTLNDPLCKLATFARRASFHFSSWTAVIAAFDRFMFVFYEHRFAYLRTKRSLTLIILVTYASIVVVDIPNLFYYLSAKKVRVCTATFDIILSSDIISIIVRTYIPLALIAFFDLSMIRKLAKRTAKQQQQASSSSSVSLSSLSSSSHQRRRERSFTIAVISSGLIFFLTKFPTSIVYIVYDIKLYSGALNIDPYESAVYNLAFFTIVNFSVLDLVFSFFTYAAFNKLFRKQLLLAVHKILPVFSISLRASSLNNSAGNSMSSMPNKAAVAKMRNNH